MQTDLAGYYAKRAGEYERIYAKPERQADLARLRRLVAGRLAGHEVLEIACGTGYWTEVIAPVAKSVLACDLNAEVLAVARGKNWTGRGVEFREADAYAPPDGGRPFTAAFAGFWWSHVPRRRLPDFLRGLHARLAPGATVLFIDNRYVEGSSTPLARTDAAGDTFQVRRLGDGSTHEVLKNFPSAEELRATVAPLAADTEVILTTYFWLLGYRVAHVAGEQWS